MVAGRSEHPCVLDFSKNWIRFSLAPAEGERAGVRGQFGGGIKMLTSLALREMIFHLFSGR